MEFSEHSKEQYQKSRFFPFCIKTCFSKIQVKHGGGSMTVWEQAEGIMHYCFSFQVQQFEKHPNRGSSTPPRAHSKSRRLSGVCGGTQVPPWGGSKDSPGAPPPCISADMRCRWLWQTSHEPPPTSLEESQPLDPETDSRGNSVTARHALRRACGGQHLRLSSPSMFCVYMRSSWPFWWSRCTKKCVGLGR